MGQCQSGLTVVSNVPVPQVRLPGRLRVGDLTRILPVHETSAQALRSLER